MCIQAKNLINAKFAIKPSPKPANSPFTREFTKIKSFTSNKSKIDSLGKTRSKHKSKRRSCQEIKIYSLLFL